MTFPTPDFRQGSSGLIDYENASSFTAGSLPDNEKRELCRSLLAEFGVTHVVERGGELIHSCCLPNGRHRNGDRNPSARMNWRKLTYICSGCGDSGGLLWFIATCRGDDSALGARQWLEKQVGLTDDPESLANLLAFLDSLYAPEAERRPPIPKLDPSVLDQWRYIHPWVTEVRGVPVETVMHFNVGYGTIRTRSLMDPDLWVESERIVIPHFWKGNLVGWQTRRLFKDGTPKYNSSIDFPKDQTIYNYDPRGAALVVESPFSVLSKFHCCPVIEATFGASITDHQIRLLANHPKVTLWFDNDEAGWKATRVVGDALSAYGPVDVVQSEWAADPGDFDEVTFRELMGNTVPYAVWSPPRELIPWQREEVMA